MEPISSEEGWLAATAKARKGAEEAAAVDLRESRPPLHPIPQLQGPFEESIVESCKGAQDDGLVDMDAQSHRNYLLESKEYERICGRKWRQKPGERQATESLSPRAISRKANTICNKKVPSTLETNFSDVLRHAPPSQEASKIGVGGDEDFAEPRR